MAKQERITSRALVGQNLRIFRKAAGLSQEGLADLAGISRATVAAIELGRYGSVELSTLDALATALKRPEADFLARGPSDNGLGVAFSKSAWNEVAKPSAEEVLWLSQLPESIWAGKAPSMQILYDLLELRRRHLG
jgi:transcriptional regulator with XRE-family HTH domain